MKRELLSLGFAAMLTATPLFACDQHGNDGIVEENNLWIPSNVKTVTGMNEATFNTVLDRVEKIYAPIVSAEGKTLKVERKWSDGTVNAYAQQRGNTWQISMFGGLARHETVTPDGFALVACHELGHHLGGQPRKRSWFGTAWASNEGQSDYFGSSKCMRKYMEEDDNVALMDGVEVPAFAVEKCEANFSNVEEIAMCKRNAMAGMSLAGLFRALRNLAEPLDFTTPDDNVVRSTDHNHPQPQCRLDTYFAGSICDVDAYADMDPSDETVNVCTRVDGYSIEARPLCWYKPRS
ncbi:MAG: hypothetical protein VXV96_04060 [Bdellovibrionota bacterium]|jgi:hypothetical protein|nr:hypothetical protein [Bdellovibrionota bacterium]